MRALLVAALLALAGCQLQEPALPGTVVSVVAIEDSEPEREDSAKYYEHPLVPEVAWHENPSWQRHVIVGDTNGIVNQAMADINGDGVPEVAFQSSFAMQAANSAGPARNSRFMRAKSSGLTGWDLPPSA